MKHLLIAMAAGVLTLGLTAQTGAQAGGSANTGAAVEAGQTNAKVDSSSSAQAGTQDQHHGAAGQGNASNDSAASVSSSNGKSASAKSGSSGSLAAGTTIPATLTKSVDARKAKPGEEITAKTTQDIHTASGLVIPRRSKLVGHVTDAKARAKGDSESALGVAFDHAVLRNGEQVPFQANIQALAAATSTASAAGSDDAFGSTSQAGGIVSAPSPSGGGRGGALGGLGSTVGGATSTVGGAANGAGTPVGDVGGVAGSTVNSGVNAGRGVTGQLNSSSTGVIGLNGLQLNSAASNNTAGSVITSTGKDVKLDSGTQMILQTTQQ
jgi:hypothetical protein